MVHFADGVPTVDTEEMRMQQLPDYGDERNKGWCVFCGGLGVRLGFWFPARSVP
jgi:hypothetical protein